MESPGTNIINVSLVAMDASTTVSANATFAAASDHSGVTAPLDIFALVCMAVLFLLGVGGNLLTIVILKSAKKEASSSYNLMLVALGTSDLICTLIVPSVFAYGTLNNFKRWDFGLVGCKVLLSVLPINVTISQGILMLMSIDRYRVVSKPFARSGISKSRTIGCIISIVVFATVLAWPRIYALELQAAPDSSRKMCNPAGHKNIYSLSHVLTNFARDIISTVILAVTGRKIEVVVAKSRKMAKYGNPKRRMASINNTRRMLRLMLIAFSVCTIPLDAFQCCLYSIFHFDASKIDARAYVWIRSINTLLYLLQTCGAVVNVFIYGARHRDFRPVVKRMGLACRSAFCMLFPCANGPRLAQRRSVCEPLSPSLPSQSISMVQFGKDAPVKDESNR